MNRYAFVLFGTLASSSHAATFTVTRTDDPAPDGCLKTDCSLREAVNAANALPGIDAVALGALTYDLTRIDLTPESPSAANGPLWVDESLVVDGVSLTRTRIRWNSPFKFSNPVFLTDTSAPADVSLSLKELTVSGGRGEQGGCVRMVSNTYLIRHKLTLKASRLDGCSAKLGGGAAYLHNADLSLQAARLTNNKTQYFGGALELLGPIDVDSSASLIRGNQAGQHGGAVRIYGNGIVGIHSDVVWVDDGSTVIDNNQAGGDGGAISVHDTATLDLSTTDKAEVGQLLRIEYNTAAGLGGGLRFAAGLTPVNSTNRVHRVRLLGNSAASGGGVHTAVSLNVSDSEIGGNTAAGGPGGGVAFAGSTQWAGGRSLQRVSVHDNTAYASGGGGIASECASFQASDVSLHFNHAASARGQGIETLGSAELRHVTLVGNDSLPVLGAPGLYKTYHTACADTSVQIANSLITDYCAATVATQLVSNGGNQLGASASACPQTSFDQYQPGADPFVIGVHPYGGDFEVVGWASDANVRPQRDFGLAAYCTATDARGFPRADGFCDAGAFEQQ